MLVIRMALLTTERLFWYCGAHTAEQTIVPIRDDFADPYYQKIDVFCGTWFEERAVLHCTELGACDTWQWQ